MIDSIKVKSNRRVLFTALRAGEALEVYRLEREGQVSYDLVYGDRKESFISREKLLKELDELGWRGWQVEAKGLMNDFSLGMAVLDRIRTAGRDPWRKWVRSAGWIQATIVGCGNWGEKIISLLDQEKMGRCGSVGVASTKGLLAVSDQLRILLVDSREAMTPQVESWIRGNGKSISFILAPEIPKEKDMPGVWIEVTPEAFHGGLEELLMELLEGCYPFGLISNSFKDLLPYLQRPYEGIAKRMVVDNEEWLETVTDEVLGTVGWDTRWGKIQLLFLLIQSSPHLVEPEHLYPLSLAIRQGVPPTCRVMASVKEIPDSRSSQVKILLLGLKPEKRKSK